MSQPADDRELTDAEIYKLFHDEMIVEWLGVLDQLWLAFGKPPEPDRLQVYRNLLGHIPLELLSQAVRRAIQDHRFNSVPTVHDVVNALRKVLGNPFNLDTAIEIWEEARWNAITFDRFQVVAAETAEPA